MTGSDLTGSGKGSAVWLAGLASLIATTSDCRTQVDVTGMSDFMTDPPPRRPNASSVFALTLGVHLVHLGGVPDLQFQLMVGLTWELGWLVGMPLE